MTGRMRVIAGEARGLTLVAPPGVRPTSGRVREALFASLGDVSGSSVLDLYAGSGALAIEALSRGAALAVLIESDRAAAEVCLQNLITTHVVERARMLIRPVDAVLAGAVVPEAPFDLVCCDPPYGMAAADVRAVLGGLEQPGWLGPDGRVVLERPAPRRAAAEEPGWGDAWSVGWERRYGDTLVTVLRSSKTA